MYWFILPVIGAATIALGSAILGVGMARLIWADDLKQAIYIDEIRSKTENNLRELIAIQETQLKLCKQP